MRQLLILISITILCSVFFWPKKTIRKTLTSDDDQTFLKEHLIEIENKKERNSEKIDIPTHEDTADTPPQPATRQKIKNKAEIDPYHEDRFTLRKLNLPQPKSAIDLLTHLTTYKKPLLPVAIPGQAEDGDGDILAQFRGYYELLPKVFKRMQLDQVAGEGLDLELTIQNEKNLLEKWKRTPSHEDFQIRNFNQDPYSLVVRLPDQRTFYFKFFSSNHSMGSRGRMLGGWIISPNAKTTQRMVLFADYSESETENDEYSLWPKLEFAQKFLPQPLPIQ